MKYAIMPLVLTVSCLAVSSAAADEPALRGETFCFPAKSVPKLVRQLESIKPERRDVVDVRLAPRFIIKDDGVWPEKFCLAKDGELVVDLPFSRETGDVPTFLSETQARPDTDICVDDPTRADRPETDEGLYFEMGLSPLFKSTPGQHSFDELREAAKDGKKFYKKMLPGPVALLMPDTDYFAVRMIDRMDVPTVFTKLGENETPVVAEQVKDMWVVSLDDIKAAEAESLIIRGGAYDLQPVPSPKTLRRFGMGEAAHAE